MSFNRTIFVLTFPPILVLEDPIHGFVFGTQQPVGRTQSLTQEFEELHAGAAAFAIDSCQPAAKVFAQFVIAGTWI